MPKKSSKRRRNYSKLRDKKINTLIEKRINEISKANIRANDIIHRYSKFYLKESVDWVSICSLPEYADFRLVDSGTLEGHMISDCGGLIHDANLDEVATNHRGSMTVGVKGVQARFGIQNRSTTDCRVSVQLLYIPNYNINTDDATDYLNPNKFYLWKYGTGNILFDGWDKEEVKNNSPNPEGAVTYSVLARKTFRLAGTTTGSNPNFTQFTKRITLQKVWKNYRRHNIKLNSGDDTAQAFTDGNYFITIHSDLPESQDSLAYICATTMKFQIRGSTYEVGA